MTDDDMGVIRTGTGNLASESELISLIGFGLGLGGLRGDNFSSHRD